MSISLRSLWRIIGFSQLILLLSFGYFAVVVQAAELPLLGEGKAIDSTGTFISTNATFAGGALVEGVDYQSYLQTTPSSAMKGQGRITVDPSDVGKQADLLYVVGIDRSAPFDGGVDIQYFAVDGAGIYFPLDLYNEASVWMAQLAETPFKRDVTLQNEMVMDVAGKLLEYPNLSYSFIGYRLQDGTIVYTALPIVVSTVTDSTGTQPAFPGLVQLTSIDTDKISLAWLPATDDTTPANAINYQVHLSDQSDFTPSTTTLYTTVVGQQQAEIVGLATGHTYNVLVVAVDQDGNESVERDYRTATTFAEPVIVSQTTQFAEDKDLGLGEATTSDGVQFTYPSGGTPPQVGSVLFANVGEDIYLRKVDSVTPTADGVTVQTSEAELADVIEQGTIDSEMTLFDVEDESIRSGTRSGRDRAVMRWQDNLLVAEQENFATTHLRADKDDRFKAKPFVIFEPRLRNHLRWKVDPISKQLLLSGVTVNIKGTLTAGIGAEFNFDKAGSVTTQAIPIFSRSFTMRYLVGGVPVYQRNTLSLKAVLSAEASTQVHADAEAKMSVDVQMGAQLNFDGTWALTPPSAEFDKSFIINVGAHGQATGRIRLIPNLQVEFYRTLAVDSSVEPILVGEIAAETIGKADLLESFGFLRTQLTQLDFTLQAETFMGISFGMFSRKIPLLRKTQLGETRSWLLFSLPKLSLNGSSGKVGEPITLTASTEDGVKNPFNEGSIRWNVYPDKGSISGEKTGTFVPTEEGNYTVFFSGHSLVGEPNGRQFAVAEVSVGKKNCDSNSIVGKWQWFNGTISTFYPNGTSSGSHGYQGTWQPGYVVTWHRDDDKTTWVDTLTLSSDGQTLDGQNQKGNHVWGTRLSCSTD